MLDALKSYFEFEDHDLLAVFEALSPDANIYTEVWDGGAPGLGGVWRTANIPARSLGDAMALLGEVVGEIRNFWSSSGYDQAVRVDSLKIESAEKQWAKERAANLRFEEQEKKGAAAYLRERNTCDLLSSIEAFIATSSATYKEFGSVLVAPNGDCFVLLENTYRYLRDDFVDWRLLAEVLGDDGNHVVELAESYPAGSGRLPIVMGETEEQHTARLSRVSGWRQQNSLLLGTDGQIHDLATKARAEYNQHLARRDGDDLGQSHPCVKE